MRWRGIKRSSFARAKARIPLFSPSFSAPIINRDFLNLSCFIFPVLDFQGFHFHYSHTSFSLLAFIGRHQQFFINIREPLCWSDTCYLLMLKNIITHMLKGNDVVLRTPIPFRCVVNTITEPLMREHQICPIVGWNLISP